MGKPLYARAIDRLYGLTHGTAAAAWKAGKIPGKRCPRGIRLSAKVAEELWGEGSLTRNYVNPRRSSRISTETARCKAQ